MSDHQLDLALIERDLGIARVTLKNPTFVATWRAEARRIARTRPDRIITADDLREHAAAHPELPTPSHHNAWGAIFSRNEDFVFDGYTKSRQPQGHKNLLRKWKLRETA